ncbi:hypothetical protein F5144DRAFT_591766 [Chaetomium tenue]|uniref:Uncharacterized protein n=1 Tax=Chaetomium tenue TaxID=1854479 RepID=A0ACB7PCB1_9PEZI|nr:hypothetical protein F5144DRAFT_591766 [Chaetomium globosum]
MLRHRLIVSGYPRCSPPQNSTVSQALTRARLRGACQFGTPSQSPVAASAVTRVPRARDSDLVKAAPTNGSGSLGLARGGQLPANIVENPPDLHLWRQKLFDLQSPVILTNEEYDMYFPWVDNVYSHRTSQTASKRGLVTRYFDCRLKGRPSGTPKSQDPNKKKRKRTARPLDLCDVRIKITEYPASSVGELTAIGHAIGLDSEQVEAAVSRIRDRPFRVIQRNGMIGNGDDGLATHKHDLKKSDETKKSTALRYLAGREREVKRVQKPPAWKPKGNAAATAKDHSGDADIKFYSACFCHGLRVSILRDRSASQAQTHSLARGKPERARPRHTARGLEDTNNTVPLHPTIPKLKANCRLWIDFTNTRIVPSFSSVLLATVSEGPYFLGDHMCLVDVHLAPFALRLSRLALFSELSLSALPTRWKGWLNALEQNPHVCSTMSTDALYAQSMDDLIKGFQRISD